MLQIFKVCMDYYASWVRMNKTIEELNRLSDRELKDLGIYRCHIPYIAYEANTK